MFQVSDRAGRGVDVVEAYAKAFAEHSPRIANAAITVDGISHRKAMDQIAIFRLFDQRIPFLRATNIGVGDFMTRDRDLDFLNLRIKGPAGQIDEYPVDTFAGQLFSQAFGNFEEAGNYEK